MSSPARRILITQAHLVRFQGSEMVTLELATHFARHGWDVVVATHSFGADLIEPFRALEGVRVFELPDPALETLLKEWVPEIAWIHHGVIPGPILRNAPRIRFVFHHMSSFLPVELPVTVGLEAQLATVSTFISDEVREVQLASGLFEGLPPERLQLFENPAPDDFTRERSGESGDRMLVVSNHIPEEFVEALPELRRHFTVDLVGAQHELGAVSRRVDSDLVAESDVIVSIGKTVQYAIASGATPYVYDHFGGPGWVDESTFDSAARSHFSGRGFEHKDAARLVAELTAGRAPGEAAWRAAIAPRRERYLLGPRLESLLNFVDTNPRDVAPLSELRVRQHLAAQEAFGTYVREWIRMWGDNQWHEAQIAAADARIRALEVDRRVLESIPGYRTVRRIFHERLERRRNELLRRK